MDKDNEDKFNTMAVGSNQTVSPSATIYTLGLLTRGTGPNDRVGNNIRLKSIEFRIRFQTNTAGAGLTDGGIIRMMLFIDKQPNGALFTNTELFAATTATLISNSPLNPNNSGSRFIMLKQWNFAINVFGGATNVPGQKMIVYHRRFKNNGIKVQYNNGNAGTIADITHNAVHLIMLSSQQADFPLANGVILYRYEDA